MPAHPALLRIPCLTDIRAEKAALRDLILARRKTAHRDGAAKGAAANARLLALIGPRPGLIVAGYRPIRTEIDPTPAMTALVEAGTRVCVPVIEGKDQPLTFREWTAEAEMVDGPYGASVPARGDWLEPQIVIAPLVAWDRRGVRLGYGGGYYDRTLAILRDKRPTYAYGFAYAAQEAPEVPHEPVDQPLDGLATEAETLDFAR